MTYHINHSDQNPDSSRRIDVTNNTFNGPANPYSSVAAPGSTGTELSISLYGKDQVNYGEKIQENLLYLLENFSGITEPTFAVNGQLWFDRSNTPNSLKIFNSQKHPITTVTLTLTNLIIEFVGTAADVTRFNTMIANSNNRFRIISNDPVYNPNIPPVTYERSKVIEFTAIDTLTPGIIKLTLPLTPTGHYIYPALTPPDNNLVGWYIGGWENIVQGNTTGGDLDMQGFKIINLATATNPLDAVNYQTLQTYVASQVSTNSLSGLNDVNLTALADSDILLYNALSSKWINIPLSVAAGTIPTNFSGLANDDILVYDAGLSVWKNEPPSSHPKIVTATLTAVQPDDILMYSTGVNEFVNVSIANHPAGILTAQITAPINNDILIYDGGISAWKNAPSVFLPLAGGTMTGTIDMGTNTISNVITPVLATDVANKQYVDTVAATSGVTGGLYDYGTGNLILTGSSIITIQSDTILSTVRSTVHEQLRRCILTTDGISTVYNFGINDPTFKFVVGYNHLHVYNNGIKSYMNTNGYLIVNTKPAASSGGVPLYNITAVDQINNKFTITGNFASLFTTGLKIAVGAGPIPNNGYYIVAAPGAINSGGDTIIPVTTSIADPGATGSIYFSDLLTLTMPTGLAPATTYQFQMGIDGSALTTYSILGSNAQTLETLMSSMNVLFGSLASVILIDHRLKFRSSTSGATSAIDLADGVTNPLFANLIGDTTSIINIDDKPAFATSPAITGQTFGYSEVGSFGTISSSIQFTTAPPAGQYIEAVANYVFIS
jgi:hypothetical protein